ncbi:phosphodiesterase (plasmid) [Haloferax mediterranei ATCC 33500]|uniref:Phosphodiesterase n=2 Tax=Haloferax mediterranei (strain ATCC 33500 / DSM 1411 / JCM 8866 / NBRC 14739 / NCIMB 2177 / R-4) TaxID=523841 RepID=A0A4P8P8L8_HALMT|nr:alkaline phosphatase family protein [Haloferax mediterranei]QCQ77266.1 phosphodiesterase [Haloferax mediterranei ATCC 33500]
MSNDQTGAVHTLLVGLDAACLPVLRPLFEEGEIPTLHSIFSTGTYAPLESQIPPWTASAWPSLYTGMNPGKHGVFDFLSFDGYDWSVVNGSHIRERTLWEVLDYHGYSSVVVNTPVTHPPRPFDGALVPGYTAPENPQGHPAGILDEVRDAIGEYRVYPRDPSPDDEKESKRYCDLVKMRGEAFQYLVDRFEPEFGFIQFQQTDTVFHERPGDLELVRDIYVEVDQQLEAIFDAYRPENVLVVSDHGMGKYTGYEFRVNEFLSRHGYVETVNGGQGMPTWATVRDSKLRSGVDAQSVKQGLRVKAIQLLARTGITSQRVGALLERVGLDDVVASWVPTDVISAATRQVDFERSTAYLRSRTELGIRINLEGREPNGVVSPEDYESVRTELIDLLQSVTDPDGRPVFDDVAPRESYLSGPRDDEAVDIVLVPRDFDQFLSSMLSDTVFDEPSEPWNHKLHGVVAAVGNDIDVGASLEDAHLFDIAPTVLATFGVEADDRMDGQTLPIVDSVKRTSYPDPEVREIQETDDTDVEERLANLGYLE